MAQPLSVSPPSTEPIVDPQTLELRRAILTDEDGFSVYKRLLQDNRWRNDKAAAIMRKYNDEQPWDQAKMDAAKQGWRRNASTGFFSSLIKRMIPPYKQLIDSSRVLTHSHLKQFAESEEAKQKSETFQVETTKTIRRWSGWNAFNFQVILENCLFGYTGGGWTDEVLWEPTFLRQDEAFFPAGSPQEPERVPLWCKHQNFLVHEMAAYLSNPEASTAAGWELENVIDAINDAKPENRKSGKPDEQRKYEDVIRETSLGTSFMEGVKVVETVHLFAQEAWGPVSHYIYNRRNGKLLFKRMDRFENMPQCLRLLTIEVGNGNLHGSKGAGRVLYNTSVSAEQARNNICDMLYLSGLLLLKATDEAKPQQALTVAHPVAVIGTGYEVAKMKFEVDADAFFSLDRHTTQIAELQIGSFMPGQMTNQEGDARTASEINYIASIEQQLREGVLARFWSQFLTIISEMQRRMYSPDNIKAAWAIYQEQQRTGILQRISKKMVWFLQYIGAQPQGGIIIEDESAPNNDAVNACLNLLRKGLTCQEIYELANSPANQLIDDDIQQNQAAIQAVVAAYAGNPNINQVELRKMHISSQLGYDAYDRLEIPEEDQTVQAEAVRMQLLELTSMAQGEQIQISPRDPDPIHMDVIEQKAKAMFNSPPPNIAPQELIPIVQGIAQHYSDHLNAAVQKQGGKKDGLEERFAFLSSAQKILGSLQAPAKPNLPGGVAPALPTDPTQPQGGGAPAPTAPPSPGTVGMPHTQLDTSLPASVQSGKVPQPIPPNAPGGMPFSKGPQKVI